MFFQWLKQYMPRSLYGRAALILIVPVVTLQLGVFLVFIQRHFEGVTFQLGSSIAAEVALIQNMVSTGAGEEAIETARELNINLAPANLPIPDSDRRDFFDLTGIWVIKSLRGPLPELVAIDLTPPGRANLYFSTNYETWVASIPRARLSAANPHQLLVWTVAIGAFMTLIAYFYLRNQLRPIKRMAEAAEEFGKGRHTQYAPSGATEVRAAGQAFLEMRARIERHIEQRTLILSGVSHDLRTPLTRLKLGLSMMDDDDADAMKADVEDMQRLLDEFLEFARRDLESTQEVEGVDPLALVREIVATNQDRGIPISAGSLSGEGFVQMRPISIQRALDNLIGNAARFGDKITISANLTPRVLILTVEDNGPGIPLDERENALKPFSRLDPARNQNHHTGVGLGLSIAADIARAHGGSLRLGESDSLGGLKAEIVIAR